MRKKILEKTNSFGRYDLDSGRRSIFQLLMGLASWQLVAGKKTQIANDAVVLKNGWVVKKSEVRD